MRFFEDTLAALVGGLLVVGCAALAGAYAEPTPCTITPEARERATRIELEFMAEAVSACRAEGAKTRATCKAYPAIEAKYDARRAAWAGCK